MSFREGQGQRRFLERSNEVMEFSRNIARSKGQGQTSFPAKCVQLHVLIWYCFTCHARAVRQKKCTVSSSADYINRAATAITITTVLRSLQSTWTEHYRALLTTSRCHSKFCKYILYIIFVCTKLIHRNHNRSPIFAHLFRRITSNDEIHMFKM